MIKVVTTDYVSDAARMIREAVFINEQKFTIEFDDIDAKAICMVLYEDETPMACCRYFKGNEEGEYVVGRLAVRQEYRGQHLGERMLQEVEQAVRNVGGKKLSLSAQVRVQGFYEKQGFVKYGDLYYDEYCEHIHMEKLL